ncbi:uncharacterized protein N7483_001612 [Penicillium malachiteum]|uniref:uncharacterized protein n=1 Tax=Penicillium malachiteum TaxID=1324776 RepID=UPI0025493651|nr:uncharacterized protein N7483_001612 [Penicillium malachiteum]KAJ5736487.1 hypothetical protein N7483_001612 [Penicillium malachiteum]
MAAGPLTTTFTPSSGCVTSQMSTLIYYGSSEAEFGSLLSYHWDTTACFPESWSPASYFSPGLDCPKGYTTDPAQVQTVIQGNVTETHATCCPSGWELNTNGLLNYYLATQPCISTETGTNTINSTEFAAYAVTMYWQASDLPASTIATTTDLDSTISPTASSTTPTNTSSSSNSSNSHSSGLSDGAKAGIGVGVSVGAIAILAAIWAIFFRRRSKSDSDMNATSTAELPNDQAPMDAYNDYPNAELPGNPQHAELASNQPAPVELPAETVMVETKSSTGSNAE